MSLVTIRLEDLSEVLGFISNNGDIQLQEYFLYYIFGRALRKKIGIPTTVSDDNIDLFLGYLLYIGLSQTME